MDLISVIVPIFNVEPFLVECLESIVNQSYKNLEIILVDDGSPDGCPEICDTYAERDKRIIVIHQDNAGLSMARNAGLDMCSGEFIMFVDSDDYLVLSSVEVLYREMSSEKEIDVVIGSRECVDIYGTLLDEKGGRVSEKTRFTNIEPLSIMCTSKYIGFASAWGKLFRRNVFSTIRFPKGRYYEDAFLSPYYYYNSRVIVAIPDKVYNYRKVSTSITGMNMSEKHFIDGFESKASLVEFIYEKKLEKLLSHNVAQCGAMFPRAYSSLNLKDKETKKLVKRYKKRYNKLYFKSFFCKMTMKHRLQSTAIFISPRIYQIIVDTIKANAQK